MLFELFNKLKTMEPGPDRDDLARLAAEQMKRDLVQWSHGACSDEKVVSDLARFTDGVIQLDVHELQNMRFTMPSRKNTVDRKKNKKRQIR